VKLKVVVGSNTGEELRIPGPKFFVGRAEDCHLRPRSDLISRHHCVLILEGSYLGVRDFGSKNGTQVNGERVAGERELKAGDRLKIGPLEFEVKVVDAPAPSKKKPKVTSIKEAANRAAETGFDLESSVGDWLNRDEGDSTMDAETKEIARVDTEEVVLGGTSAAAEAAAEEAPSEPAAEKKTGKLPAAPKSESAFNAAADMLRKLRKR
jgi:pSer/pThr/pTyr-binding forkhead associated (FHA) protein